LGLFLAFSSLHQEVHEIEPNAHRNQDEQETHHDDGHNPEPQIVARRLIIVVGVLVHTLLSVWIESIVVDRIAHTDVRVEVTARVVELGLVTIDVGPADILLTLPHRVHITKLTLADVQL